MTELQVRLI